MTNKYFQIIKSVFSKDKSIKFIFERQIFI